MTLSHKMIMIHPFFQLIRIAIGCADALDSPIDDKHWETVYALARKHALIGFINQAIERLPENQKPPRKIKVMFALTSEKIAGKNSVLDDSARQVEAMLQEAGIKSCILKGQAVARLYPVPKARQCGDIDVWVDKSRKEVLRLLSSRWKTGDVFYHHVDLCPSPNFPEVEVHFTPSWMNDPFDNMKLQKYFRDNASCQFANYNESLGFTITTIGFDCVFSLVHIYRHLLQEGIGLRQIMDYYYILKASSRAERLDTISVVRRLGMSRFTSAMMYVLMKITGINDDCLLCDPNEKYGEFLLCEIMKSGNFGKYDSRNYHAAGESQFHRFCRRLVRLPRYFSIAPREVLWAPVFRIWQQTWRVIHRY